MEKNMKNVRKEKKDGVGSKEEGRIHPSDFEMPV